MGGDRVQHPVSQKKKVASGQKLHKNRYQSFSSCIVLLDFLTLFQYFCSRLYAWIYIILNPGRLSGRNDVTLSKVNFRPDIRQNFFFCFFSAFADHITSNFLKLSSTSFTWSILSSISIGSSGTSVVFKEHLVPFSLLFFWICLEAEPTVKQKF